MSPVDKLFAAIPKLPSIPKVVQELIASLCKEDVDIATLVDQVRQDQSLSARVLKMANSAQFGSVQKIGSIDKAVQMIGLSALRSLVIASGMSSAIAKVEGVDMKKFWRHALISAGVAKVFGKREGVNPEFAYTAGLMHRVGQLMIHMAYPAAAKQLTRSGPSEAHQLKVERSLIETDHCEVGAELAIRWSFPVEIQDALRHYVDPLAKGVGPLAAVVHLASHIAEGLDAGQEPAAIAGALNEAVLTRLSLEHADAVWRIENCKELPSAAEQYL